MLDSAESCGSSSGVVADGPIGTSTDVERAAVLDAVHRFERAVDDGAAPRSSRHASTISPLFGSRAGEECQGPAAPALLLAGLRSERAHRVPSWSLTMNDDYAVSVRGDAALITASGQFDLRLDTDSRSGRYLLLYVLHRVADGWKVWAYHGSEPQPW